MIACTVLSTAVAANVAVVRETGTIKRVGVTTLHDNSGTQELAKPKGQASVAPVAKAVATAPVKEPTVRPEVEKTFSFEKTVNSSSLQTLKTDQVLGGIKAHNRSALTAAKTEEKNLDKVLNKLPKTDMKKMKQRSKMGNVNKMDADSIADPIAESVDDGEGDEPKIIDEGMTPVGVLGSPNSKNRQEQIVESKFVYGFLISIVLFTLWWTNGSPSTWGRAIQWEVRSVYVPGVGRPKELFEGEYSEKGGKTDLQVEMKKRVEDDGLL